MADGVDNLNPDGSFDCGGHNLWGRPGNARWTTKRWKRGTAPAGGYDEYECPKGHQTKVHRKSSDSRQAPKRCANLFCRSTDLRYRGGAFWGPNTGMWPYELPTPRTCTFCGGVHPDDAIALIAAGFRLAGTDKGYKHYIEVPAGNPGLVPPLKLYGNHVSQAHADAINATIMARKVA